MSEAKETGKVGPLFEDFLREQGICEETTERSVKRVLAFQLSEIMRKENISKPAMAERLNTTPGQLDELLDPQSDSVTLGTLAKAAEAVGRTLKVDLQ